MVSWWYTFAARRTTMKRTNIYLDEAQARLLRHLAVETNRSFTDIVREALTEYLTRRGLGAESEITPPKRAIPDDEWRQRIQQVLEEIHTNLIPGLTPGEIEAEITVARE